MSTTDAFLPRPDDERTPATSGEEIAAFEADAQDLSMAGPDGAGAASVDDPANGPVGDGASRGEPVFRTPDPDDPTRPAL